MRFFYERGGKCELLSAKGLTSAAFWLGTLDVFYYAPVLFALALVTGAATGFLAQEVLRRMGKHGYVQPLDFIVVRPFLDFKNKKNSQKL